MLTRTTANVDKKFTDNSLQSKFDKGLLNLVGKSTYQIIYGAVYAVFLVLFVVLLGIKFFPNLVLIVFAVASFVGYQAFSYGRYDARSRIQKLKNTKTGKFEKITITRPLDVVEISEVEDEGLMFLIQADKETVLVVTGQWLYALSRKFPNDNFEIVVSGTEVVDHKVNGKSIKSRLKVQGNRFKTPDYFFEALIVKGDISKVDSSSVIEIQNNRLVVGRK